MVNGGHAEQGPTMLPGTGVKDKIAGDVVQTVAEDGRKEITEGVTREKIVVGGDDDDDEVAEQEEDVYSMDVCVESVKRSRSVVKEVASITMVSTASELDTNGLSNMTRTTVINKSASESEGATDLVRAEIQSSDAVGPRATAASKEDTTDLNESPKLQLENESEVTVVNRASPTPVHSDIPRAVQALEVLEEATAKTVVAVTEVVGTAALWPNLDANEPLQGVKTAKDTDVDMMAFGIMKVDEAESLHDLKSRMVVTSACGTCYTSGGDHELYPAVMHRESDAEQVASDSKKIWHPPGRTRESSGCRSRLNATMAIVLDSEGPVLEGLPSKTKRPDGTELEGEIQLYGSSEREEQARLLGLLRGEPQPGKQYLELQNDKKRALEIPLQERQRKLSRKIHTADERKKDEEDVCFICFDGGDLVLCDRRSCPKAYHLSCIGRDAAFFKKKGAWLCGWHFCSVCTKPGSFQCYSCPTAYCGSCITTAEFLLLRKRKGLCEDCLPIVSMIERNETINGDGVEVDFEDQETYECLFKEYWEDLKRRLSLVMPELDKDGKPMGGNDGMLNHGGSETEEPTENDESDKETDESDHDNPDPECAVWKKRRSKKNRMGSEKMDEHLESEDDDEKEGQQEQEQELLPVVRSQKFESWASEELLDFIEYMKEDPTKPLSRFAVNKLLWSYIKRHKLQDPRKSSQINCDERLKSIFGKESVGQFEMFKHLQIHFPAGCSADGKKSKDAQIGDDAMNDDDVVGGDGNEDKFGTSGAKERRRGRRPTDEKFERPNSSEYAAITPKNMDLIYLRRSLLRDLLDDPEFDNKVVDTFVRIRVPGISTKSETTYRLVLVTGTRIGEESYKAGTKITSVVLEILNLQKKEDVTVDLVSNQDFTEEECQRLRQSIKCGFIKALTVGQVEEKAIALREAKVNDWFESEKQRLINLRDRASEKGRKKELRECVEKLQELGSPAFRAAKLQARPEVTADPHMDPGYESDLNEIAPLLGGSHKFRQKLSPNGGLEKGTGIGFRSWDAFDLEESVYSGRKGDPASQRSKSSWEETGRKGRVGYEGGRSSERLGVGRESALGVDGKSLGSDERDRSRLWDKNWERYQSRDQDRSRSDGCTWNGNGGRIDVVQWVGEVGDSKYCRGEARAGTTPVFGQSRSEWENTKKESVPSATLSGSVLGYGTRSPGVRSLATLEKEKIWHYQDPTGMVQGPFTMEQLRKWNTTGLFPVNLTIWKTGEVQENSMLLTDAMAGRFKEELLAALRSMPGDFAAVESPTPRCSSSWGVGDAGHSSSRAEQGQSMTGADWDSRNAVERGGNWARGQSSYGGPSSTGRADDWSSSRPRADSDIWGSSRKGADGNSWGDSESGKSTYGRSSSGREFEASAPRDGSRSTRVPRGSKKDVPCRFYAKGYCKRGDSCEFWHG